MRKKLILCLVVLVVLVLAIPVLNLIMGAPENALTDYTTKDDLTNRVIHTVSTKCVSCHTSEPQAPLYSRIPGIRDKINDDIWEASTYIDYVGEFQGLREGQVSEVALAKTEHAVSRDRMPPRDYLLMYWNHGLTDSEKKDILAWVSQTRSEHYADLGLPADLRAANLRPLMVPEEIDEPKVLLGKSLYHDTRLSGDGTISCASCHELGTTGCDRKQFSTGIDGKAGGVNAPTVFNSGLYIAQFWDGRAADLQEQAAGPVNNLVEMAGDWDEIIAKLNKDRKFTRMFKKVYPDGYSVESITDAIATFESTLITANSAFDRYLVGDKEALTEEAKMGYALFRTHGCDGCHAGPAMGGLSYERMGIKGDYFRFRGTGETDADLGRQNVTGDIRDRRHFKVPTLRNIAGTYPYMHDGTVEDLNTAVRIMAKYQVGVDLADGDTLLITTFLESLTGEYEGRLVQ